MDASGGRIGWTHRDLHVMANDVTNPA